MLKCPQCKSQLARAQNSFGNFWHCQACDGSVVTMSLLRKFVPREALNTLWQRARRGDVPLKYHCSGCANQMKAVIVETEGGSEREVDVCTHCQSVWLDAGEWHQLANLNVVETVAPSRDIQVEVRERIAKRRLARNAPPPLKSSPPPVPAAASQEEANSVSVESSRREPAAPPPVLPNQKPRREPRKFAPRSEPIRRSSSADLKTRESKRRPIEAQRHSPNAAAEASREATSTPCASGVCTVAGVGRRAD